MLARAPTYQENMPASATGKVRLVCVRARAQEIKNVISGTSTWPVDVPGMGRSCRISTSGHKSPQDYPTANRFCKNLGIYSYVSADLEKNRGQKCSTGQRFISIEVLLTKSIL